MKRGSRCVVAALAFSVAANAWPQGSYPNRTIKIVVGFPPGTTGDLIARVMAPKLSEGLGQQVVVENRPGAGSSIGAEAVAKSPADGYTLLLSTIANTINPSLFKVPFDFAHDFEPIALVAEAPGLLVAHPSAPATIPALIAAARARPGEIAYGSSGNGTVTHLYGELFNLSAGVKLAHVPYKGSSQAVTDLLAGRIALLFTPASTVVPYVKAGKLQAVGVIGRQRLDALPEVPTLAEAGVPGFEASLWFGLNAPAGTPRNVLDRLNQETARVLASPEVGALLGAQSIDPAPGSSANFGAFIRQQTEKWARVVKAAGVTAE